MVVVSLACVYTLRYDDEVDRDESLMLADSIFVTGGLVTGVAA